MTVCLRPWPWPWPWPWPSPLVVLRGEVCLGAAAVNRLVGLGGEGRLHQRAAVVGSGGDRAVPLDDEEVWPCVSEADRTGADPAVGGWVYPERIDEQARAVRRRRQRVDDAGDDVLRRGAGAVADQIVVAQPRLVCAVPLDEAHPLALAALRQPLTCPSRR